MGKKKTAIQGANVVDDEYIFFFFCGIATNDIFRTYTGEA